jgi:hypothetical protein
MSEKNKYNFEKSYFNEFNFEIENNKCMEKRSKLNVKFSPIVKIINVESYKEYNKRRKNSNLSLL